MQEAYQTPKQVMFDLEWIQELVFEDSLKRPSSFSPDDVVFYLYQQELFYTWEHEYGLESSSYDEDFRSQHGQK